MGGDASPHPPLTAGPCFTTLQTKFAPLSLAKNRAYPKKSLSLSRFKFRNATAYSHGEVFFDFSVYYEQGVRQLQRYVLFIIG